ncbi:MAG: hypothetical protein HY906_14545 [Deltaproteobacteria bacterium]|nr:hypothetical protein [Deltaproteobacteria bacterium]
MNRLATGFVVTASLVALVVAGCGSDAAPTRHVSAKLKLRGTYTSSTGKVLKPRAADVIKAQLKGRAVLRAEKSPAWAKQLAKKFTRLGSVPGSTDRLRQISRATGRHPLDIVFDNDIAVFAYDDFSGDWLDAQYLDPEDGFYDLGVPEDSPVSLWYGTYDDALGYGEVIAPTTYGWDYELAPDDYDIDFEYDPYLWVDPEEYPVVDTYAAGTETQEGYYQVDWIGDDGSQGTAWFYLLPDAPEYGSYYLLWDDSSCMNGTQVYISFDSSGTYWSINGLDAPVSFSGATGLAGYVEGEGRMTVVGDDGLTYYATIGLSYYAASTDTTCWDTAPTVDYIPEDPVEWYDGCDWDGTCCPAGCVPDDWYGICVIEITYDPYTGTGASCDLVDVADGIYTDWCAPGCALWDDGFCYDGDPAVDPLADICI